MLFGATVLAAATSLPELSTGITAVRSGDYQLAFGDIFGGNAFLPVLLLLATVVSGKAILPNAHNSDLYLTALGALLTLIYMAGLIFRPSRQYARLGIDSIAVLGVYVDAVIGLVPAVLRPADGALAGQARTAASAGGWGICRLF